MNKEGDPMAMWESQDMREKPRQEWIPPPQSRKQLTKEEEEDAALERQIRKEAERSVLRIAKSRIRQRCGALVTNYEVDKMPPPMTRIHNMKKSASSPSLNAKPTLTKEQQRKRNEERDTIHTLRLAKPYPRNMNGNMDIIPYMFEKVNVAAHPMHV